KFDEGTPSGARRSVDRSQHQTAAQRPRPEGSPEARRGTVTRFANESRGRKLLLVGLRRSFTAGLFAAVVQRISERGARTTTPARLPRWGPRFDGATTKPGPPPCGLCTVGWQYREYLQGVATQPAGMPRPKVAVQVTRTGQQ